MIDFEKFKSLHNNELVEIIQKATLELSRRSKKVLVPLSEEAILLVDRLLNSRMHNVPLFRDPIIKSEYMPKSLDGHDYIDFIVIEEKRTVVALVKNEGTFSGNKKPFVWAKGIAKCNPSDTFDENIGKLIALSRAFNITIDNKFLE